MATEDGAANAAIRDQVGDHLLTPKNSALVVIDYQPSAVRGVCGPWTVICCSRTSSRPSKVSEGCSALPIVHSTDQRQASGQRQADRSRRWPRCSQDYPPIDRTSDQRMGRHRISSMRFVRPVGESSVICALWTEICMAFRGARRHARGLRGLSRWSTQSAAHP